MKLCLYLNIGVAVFSFAMNGEKGYSSFGGFVGRQRPGIAIFPSSSLFFKRLDILPDEFLKLFFRRELKLVAGTKSLLSIPSTGVFDFRPVVVGAEDDPHGRVVAPFPSRSLYVVEIEIHLSGVSMGERNGPSNHQDVAFQKAVVEHQVDVIVLVVDGDPLLPGLEQKPFPNSKRNTCRWLDKRGFQSWFSGVNALFQGSPGTRTRRGSE